jgi:transposase
MSKSQLPYPAQFRQQMVELVRADRNPAELACEFGCNTQLIRNWAAQVDLDSGKPPRGKAGSLTSAEHEELARLRRQVRQLQVERDILAKAMAWFAGRNGASSNS